MNTSVTVINSYNKVLINLCRWQDQASSFQEHIPCGRILDLICREVIYSLLPCLRTAAGN